MTRLVAIEQTGPVAPWATLGFRLEPAPGGGTLRFRNGEVRIVDGPPAVTGLIVAGAHRPVPAEFDGIPLTVGPDDEDDGTTTEPHPNGAFELDHFVITTDSLERTCEAVESALGLPLKRIRETETVRQGFHRFEPAGGGRGCIVEVVESDRATGAALMGWVVNVADDDALTRFAADLGPDLVSPPKPAVQPGRRIASLRRGAGVGVPVALMTPEPLR